MFFLKWNRGGAIGYGAGAEMVPDVFALPQTLNSIGATRADLEKTPNLLRE
jgi:hypothetical protein